MGLWDLYYSISLIFYSSITTYFVMGNRDTDLFNSITIRALASYAREGYRCLKTLWTLLGMNEDVTSRVRRLQTLKPENGYNISICIRHGSTSIYSQVVHVTEVILSLIVHNLSKHKFSYTYVEFLPHKPVQRHSGECSMDHSEMEIH
jgi:hypothetical protein